MTFAEIETALGQRLQGMSGAPAIAWPNKDFAGSAPYLEFRHAPATREDDTLDCSGPMQTGIVLVTAVMPRDAFSTAANALAQSVADRFPKGLRLTAGSGKVLITAPPALATPFVDGVFYRQAVSIRYMTEN